ncbi:MAG: YchJ family metal-binding protein [Alphaproteobacteria bacterium]
MVDTDGGGTDDETGMVEFAAHHMHKGIAGIHRERSIFRCEKGNWLYVDGGIVGAKPVRLREEIHKVLRARR